MAGIYPIDNSEVKTAKELLKSQESEQIKQHIVVDAQGRDFLVFTAYIGAQEGEPCLVSEYVYSGPATTKIIGRQERVYKWKAAWDTLFAFDPTASYDPDGDGVL